MFSKLKKLALMVGAVSLAACGGGGGGSGSGGRDVAPERPVALVSGTAFDGLIIGGDVKVWDYTGGKKGSLLGTTKTNGQGLYSISLSTSDKPVLVEVEGGYYIEESSGVQVQVDKTKGHKMLAVEYYESGKSLDVSATFFTNVATGLFEYMVRAQGISEEVAVERAYAEVDAWAGFDTRRTHPVDVSDFANATPFMTDQHRYGFVAAGVSVKSLEVGNASGAGVHDFYTSIVFNQLAYQDVVFDGLLDGVGKAGRLSFGNTTLNGNSYRDQLALAMLRFANGDRNTTGMVFNDLLPFATKINQYAGDLFEGTVAPDITAIEPVISQFVPANGEVMSGSFPVSVLVSDPTGIETIHFYVDGRYVTAASPSNGRASVDTLNFTNGAHILRVDVTNFMGKTASMSRSVTINNGELRLVGSGSSTTGWTGSWTVGCGGALTLEDTTNSGIKYAKVEDAVVLLDVSGPAVVQWGVTFDGKASCAVRSVTAADNLGNVYSFPARMRVEVADSRLSGGIQYRYTCRWDVAASC